jgi:hypothetical protein
MGKDSFRGRSWNASPLAREPVRWPAVMAYNPYDLMKAGYNPFFCLDCSQDACVVDDPGRPRKDGLSY